MRTDFEWIMGNNILDTGNWFLQETIDPFFLYDWKWADTLRTMDLDPNDPYHVVYKAQIEIVQLFCELPWFYRKLHPLQYIKDIWTGNGILISHVIWELCKNFIKLKSIDFVERRLKQVLNYNDELFQLFWFNNLMNTISEYVDYRNSVNFANKDEVCEFLLECYDISKRLSFINSDFNQYQFLNIDHKYWDIHNLWWIFDHLPGKPTLITLFNILANFQPSKAYNILQEMYKHMQDNDVILMTLFQEYNDDNRKEITDSLYNNTGTEDWIKTGII